jgi:hypothetical protein
MTLLVVTIVLTFGVPFLGYAVKHYYDVKNGEIY